MGMLSTILESLNAMFKKKKDYKLNYVAEDYVCISSADDLDRLIDALLKINYAMEFCIAMNFNPAFIDRLMQAGFLVMSTPLSDGHSSYVLLPKLHLVRSVLFFPDLHIKQSIKRLLNQYELKIDTDFSCIMNRCAEIHGKDWLTEPLLDALSLIHDNPGSFSTRPLSFGVYRNGELKAGEFGVLAGSVYTSYSGYYDESNAGTVQMILMAAFLQEHGAPFLDLGMPLPYKYDLGAQDISPERFVDIFRSGREKALSPFPQSSQ
jgi:Leu/Phe-tRNA-protein transferase